MRTLLQKISLSSADHLSNRWGPPLATGVGDVSRSAHAPLQAPKTEHANTGIEVATRFQYTPLQLIDLLQDRDLKAIDVHPVHIHGVTPSFKATNADIHASIANLLQTCATHST